MNNAHKIILDLCGGTGSWSKPYAEAGYEVVLITWPEYDVTNVEFRGDDIIFKHSSDPTHDLYVTTSAVHGILAAPPCTMFSLARRTAALPPDFEGAIGVVGACMRIIWHCRATGNLKFWALENPVGLLRQFIGAPKLTFEPWWYGEMKSKRTDLWGYFKEPRRTVPEKPAGVTSVAAWQRPEVPEGFEHLKLKRSDIRSITSPAFARAFMRANQ